MKAFYMDLHIHIGRTLRNRSVKITASRDLTFILNCNQVVQEEPPVFACASCGGNHLVPGVMDRIYAITDRSAPVHPAHRPSYHYQIPLEFIPGIGKRTLDRLLSAFGTEMKVLHEAAEVQLTEAVGEKTAKDIVEAREGNLQSAVECGGKYGKVNFDRF